MNVTKAKARLEIATNIAVLVAALAIIAFFARACVSKSGGRTPGKLVAGVVLADIKNVDFSETPRTLILALSTGCKYCGENVPFYRSLAAKEAALAEHIRMVAVFSRR